MSADETPEARLKRLKMRANHRGIKEMDVILGGFAEAHLAALDEADLKTFDALLWENDHDLYGWVTGKDSPPDAFEALMTRISHYAHTRLG